MVKNYISEKGNSQIRLLLEKQLQITKFLKSPLTDAVLWVKPNANIIYVNDAACSLVGYSREELLFMSIQDLNLEFLHEIWSKDYKNIKQDGFLHFESICWNNKGQSFLLEINITYIEYGSCEFSCILINHINKRQESSFALEQANKVLERKTQDFLTKEKQNYEQLSREIIERKWVEAELQNSLCLLQATLESNPDGVIAVRCNGDIVTFNQKFVEMWQVPDSIVISRNYQQYLTFYRNQLKQPETFYQNIEQLEIDSQKDFRRCDILELKDGKVFEQYSKPLRLGEKRIGTVCSFRDITQRQQAEAEVRRILEQEKQLTEQRAQFVSMVSHEFRTPLNIISYSTSLLKRHSHRWAQEKKLQYLQHLQTAVEQITQLMDEVLIIGRLDAGKFQLEPKPLDLEIFCRDILVELNLSKKSDRAINFISQGDCKSVCLDKKLLHPILTNLLSNAIKYSSAGSKVDLLLCCEDKKVIFQVKDCGIGISIEEQQEVFKPFYRGNNVSNIPGNGLGLAIVKKLVDLHNSQISLVSEIGIGTTFTITLPI
ncbi:MULTISPECIES: PAS domain-containing sensor histidine kinase [Nostoc]|uniref:histidine kinase n=1 Tax=Nostoc paludosum FACHB-159 TaxID=2692908 RepID=A0ABR8K1W4_9NOSO|nr:MULTISPECIES: PAS domain-containing sensor histidine kinase [Nostoc]MBD2677131.1 PAS domain S-box protein [Nostoc sp. FACHB-857]MBD2733060.1 PAS domain S-box protein [Nostoc paludosum FACHB-159]